MKNKRKRKRKKVQKSFIVSLVIFSAVCGVFLMHGHNNEAKTSLYTYHSQTANADIQTQSMKPENWNLILVNSDNPIPDNYQITLYTLSNGKKVDERIYPDLQQMFHDARAEGIYPTVSEAFRTDEEQQYLMQEKIDEYISAGYSEDDAVSEAEKWVAKPGTSEHQIGLAVDINNEKFRSSADDVYNWLAENAYKYGFIQRYPYGKEDITGIDCEPWHYRYVGKEAAEEIYYSGLCLEEYLN